MPARRRILRLVQAAVCGTALLAAGALAAPTASAAHSGANPGSQSAAGFPTYLKGMVVNSSTGAQVGGIVVTLRDPVTLDLIASDTTNASGVFRMDGLDSDEYAIKFNGARRGYETGFGGCGHGVVPTYGEACTFAPGPVGRFRLDHG
ncbi:MAG TPA: carboxypeptidase-like regulatory domain-containing protein [Nocardioidaceae bacterium]|nr:carboxypeptidase-like regulatory domain-containing protein [Nocardioidaceae bacterium]